MKRVLFICRYNRFRSQIAAGFFNKYCPKKVAIGKSAGLIKGQPIGKEVRKFARVNKIQLTNPKGLERSVVNEQDIFVIVANDVSPSIFNRYKDHGEQVKVWKIKDINESKNKDLTYTTGLIENKVLKLVKELKQSTR